MSNSHNDKHDECEQAVPDVAERESRSAEEELRLALEDAKAKADEYRSELLRARAEAENIRKRSEREVENAQKLALREFLRALVPVKDSLEKGLAAAAATEHVDAVALVKGTELTLSLLGELLAKEGLVEVDPLGEKFDPNLHEAMDMRAAPGTAPNTVLKVYQKGYVLSGRLIRPALVSVCESA